ncbi:MAG: type II secretion system F family protein [Acidimicrobiia bacterium]
MSAAQFILLVLFAGAGGVLVWAGLNQQRRPAVDDAETYLRSLEWGGGEETDEYQRLLAQPFLGRVLRPLGGRVLGTISSVLPGNYREQIRRKLTYAGMGATVRPEEVITAQVLLGGGVFVLALLYSAVAAPSSQVAIILLVLVPLIATLLPNVWITRKVEERRGNILRDLPDTLDLLAISVEAGVGFEGALGIVCDHFDSPLAAEFSRTLKEMELGLPRREALLNLKRRTEVPELSNFVQALTQADALGMPIGRVLKTQAGEMRLKRRQWAREKAAKLPVKILFPLVLFIFPPVFIIVMGPAVSQIGESFR